MVTSQPEMAEVPVVEEVLIAARKFGNGKTAWSPQTVLPGIAKITYVDDVFPTGLAGNLGATNSIVFLSLSNPAIFHLLVMVRLCVFPSLVFNCSNPLSVPQ